MDKKLLEIYFKGWTEENNVYMGKIEAAKYEDPLHQRAYDIGRMDYRIGDDVSSADNKSDQEILNEIYGYIH